MKRTQAEKRKHRRSIAIHEQCMAIENYLQALKAGVVRWQVRRKKQVERECATWTTPELYSEFRRRESDKIEVAYQRYNVILEECGWGPSESTVESRVSATWEFEGGFYVWPEILPDGKPGWWRREEL